MKVFFLIDSFTLKTLGILLRYIFLKCGNVSVVISNVCLNGYNDVAK